MSERNIHLLWGISLIVIGFFTLLIVGSGFIEVELTVPQKMILSTVEVIALTVLIGTSIYKRRIK